MAWSASPPSTPPQRAPGTCTTRWAARTWHLHDALGSVRLHLDDQGQPAGSLTFDTWGTPTMGSPDPFGFAGELHSEGLQYLRARWYDPAAGVFVVRDPLLIRVISTGK